MSEKGADIQPEPEVVQPARVFAPKKCKAEGCENIFTPTVGYQTHCPEHREARERTKRSRKRAMERKAREEERANSMTRDEFWQQKRKQLTKAQREQLEQRTDDILLLAAAMDDYVSGTDQTSQQDLLDTIEEVREEVEKNGVCNLHTVLVEFWKPWEKNFFEAVVAQAGATETFVRFGFIDAIPSPVFHRFQQRFMQPKTNPTPKAEWVSLTCTTPGCGQGLHAMTRELANEYAARGVKPLCYRCLDAERKSTAQATSTVLGVTGQERNKIFDSWGRIDHWRKEEV